MNREHYHYLLANLVRAMDVKITNPLFLYKNTYAWLCIFMRKIFQTHICYLSSKGADELDLSSFKYGGMNVTGFSIKDPPFEENFQQSDCYSYKGLCPVSVRWDSEKCLVNLICIWKISHEREYVHIYLTKSLKNTGLNIWNTYFFIPSYFSTA